MLLDIGDRPFDALAGELLADEFAADPTVGSGLGLTEYDHLLPDRSAAAVTARAEAEDLWLERFESLDDADLHADERVDRDLVTMHLRGRRLMRDWQGWRRDADGYAGTALMSLFGLLLHRLRPDEALAAALTARLRAMPGLLAAGVENLDPRLASPVLLQRSLGQIAAGSAYVRSLPGQLPSLDGSAREELADAGETAAAAFEDFAAHVTDLAAVATGGWAIGEQRYDGLLRYAEGLGYGAREMRERGAEVYDRLADDMRRRTAQLRPDEPTECQRDWRSLLAEMDADRPGTPEEMREAYADITARAREFCRDRELVTPPPGDECRVEPSAPFLRGMIAVAHYISPPPFAPPPPRPGHFFVPFPPEGATAEQVEQRLASNRTASMWTVTAHEAYPGHHWHLSTLAANRTRPLRMVYGSTFFSEGWGLYSEELMREQGFFPDPRAELCQVDARLFRAARIVVDTSLHLGEMTVDEAVEHMSTHTSLAPETARAEVLRYCAWPTQAASYLTGALEIARMREAWLGAGGSLRDFHDRAAGSGRLPISLVERCVGTP